MSIVKIILFVSSVSENSSKCIMFVQKNQIPGITLVRLDTRQAREAAASGEHFKIEGVPTLVVLYQDGNMQLFGGLEKIIQWLSHYSKKTRPPPAKTAPKPYRQPSNNIYDTDPSDMIEREPDPIGIGPLPIPRGIPRRKTERNTGYREPIVDQGDDLDGYEDPHAQEYEPQEYPQEYEEEYPPYTEDIYIEETPASKPPKKSTKKKKSKSKKVEEGPNPGVIEAKQKLNKASASKSASKPSKMKGLYSKAKQMQQEMENSLGYKEEDLPHY